MAGIAGTVLDDPGLRQRFLVATGQAPAVDPMTQQADAFGGIAPPVPPQPAQALPARELSTAEMNAIAPPPVAPRPGVPSAGGGGLPTGSADLQREIDAGTGEQRQALGGVRDATLQAGEDVGRSLQDRAVADQADAQAYADKADQVRQMQQQLDQEDQAVLQQARDKHIPDFYESREGALAGAAITVALSGAAGALLGTGRNTAQEAIQHQTDAYYGRKKDEIDNAFKYAEAKGKLDEATKHRYAEQLTDLLQTHALTMDALADRLAQVKAESGSKVDAAGIDATIAGLRTKAAEEKQKARGMDIEIYKAKSGRIEANAAATRAAAERTKAAGDASEKADEAAFRTYVQGPHGKQATETTRRVEALDSAAEGIGMAKSVGEVTAQIDKAIAADAGQGTRGVSMGQLHTILPNLVSASGEISNKVSQNWDGTAGKEFRAAAKNMIETARVSRAAQYKREGEDLEKNLALTPHGQKNPAFARTARLQLYPERASSAPTSPSLPQGAPAGAELVPGKMAGGKPVYKTPDGRYWQP